MKQIESIHRTKHFFIVAFFVLAGSVIFFRLFFLQVIHYSRLATIGERNFIRLKMIPAQRGNILDCNGTALVTNCPVTSVFWQGTGNQQLSLEQKQTIQKLEQLLQKPISEKKIAIAEKFLKQVEISDRISPEQLYRISEQCSDTGNVEFESFYERFYPYNRLACHIIGYLSDSYPLMQGKMGLEKLCEEELKGQPGVFVQHVNSFGTLLESKHLKDQSSGKDLATTIDLSLQKIAEQCMQNQEAGVFLLINPKTGAIPALVSLPSFDPSLLSKRISNELWQELQENRPFVNRAFNASYPPASIFKLVTVTAALEEKLLTTDSVFVCNGYTTFKDRQYYCNKHSGHGRVTLKEGVAYSCNIPCYKVAQHMPIDTLASYAFEYGLGAKTDILFSEKSGLIPTNEWKKAYYGERWWTGETLSASIGQSFLLVTPIQVACMIGSIFEGYLVKPRILQEQEIIKKPIAISRKTREFMQECMRSVIAAGTARRMSRFCNITIFAKTGTAQTINRNNKDEQDGQHLEHAWFVSYFYTAQTEPLVMVILLEHVGGSRIAGGVAKEFFSSYMKMIRHMHS
ncbi:hypothetical protein HYV11_02335 [Candidatus Dependentiae bacterium]|nr:hypothetical protein [Candidatus Dependentiae bacterium]